MTSWSFGNQFEEINAILPSTSLNLELTSHLGKRDISSSLSGILIAPSQAISEPDSVSAELMGAQLLISKISVFLVHLGIVQS